MMTTMRHKVQSEWRKYANLPLGPSGKKNRKNRKKKKKDSQAVKQSRSRADLVLMARVDWMIRYGNNVVMWYGKVTQAGLSKVSR